MSKELLHNIDNLYQKISAILENARNKVYRAANFEMVQSYWEIGREIVEEEQQGEERAEYGKYIIKNLSEKLTKEYGKGYIEQNLRNMRLFYTVFSKRNALRSELTWTHYRILMRVENDITRHFYLDESIAGNWGTRELERQINSLYFERLLASKDKKGMIKDGRETEDKILATRCALYS